MQVKYKDWQYWLLQNLQLLAKVYGQKGVMLDSGNWQSILISKYWLPSTWRQASSRLLIILPQKSQIFYTPPDRFYLDLGLRALTGEKPAHYFERGSFNDMARRGMARFSFHLKKGWQPKINCQEGTNLLHVLEGLYKGMDSGAREAMR